MPQDVVITPANGKMEFFQSVGGSAVANIQLDSSTSDLSLSTTAGNLIIGDASRDVYIGDGINSVDIVFEQDGEIRGLTNKTLTLGQSDSIVNFNTLKTTFSAGNVGIGTTNPLNVLHIRGNDSAGPASQGPKLGFTTTTDIYPLFQIMPYTHDNVALLFDAYYDNGWKSSDAGSNFSIYKLGDSLRFRYKSGVSQGIGIAWDESMVLNAAGNVGIGTANPSYKLDTSINTVNFGNVRSTGGIAGFYLQDRDSNGNGWQWYSQDGILKLYDNTATVGDRFFVKKNGTNAEFGINGSPSTNRILTINNVSSDDRPAIKIVNPNFYSDTSSTGRTFYRWMPIDIDSTTYWIPIYTA